MALDPVRAATDARYAALLERVAVLEQAIEAHLKAVDADLCCAVCEPGGPGEHRSHCTIPALQDALDA